MTLETNPLVSICIPAFNAAHLLGESLGSAVRQTYSNLEILIFDNASTDNTAQVVQDFSATDRRVRYLRHPENVGMISNFNACMKQAKGRYIKFICADDALEPDCVRQMVHIMTTRPQVKLVACARRLVDDKLRQTGIARYSRRFVITSGAQAIRHCFFVRNQVGQPTAAMFLREDAARGFDERYRQILDVEMWLHLLEHGDFAYLPDPLCKIRQHPDQVTIKNIATGIVLNDKRSLFRKFAPVVGKNASLLEKASWDVRMAVTVYRSRKAGYAVSPDDVDEVFFRRIFPGITYPAGCILWALIGRTS